MDILYFQTGLMQYNKCDITISKYRSDNRRTKDFFKYMQTHHPVCRDTM